MSSNSTTRPKPIGDPPTLYIDSNEEATWHYSNEVRPFGFSPMVTPLPYGDFRFIVNNRLWSIERKRAPNDLESSFTDGRLASQAQRILANYDTEAGVILIEGNPNEVMLHPNIMNTLLELQANGLFVDHCKVGEIGLRLYHLYTWLSKEDHSFLTRPTLPLPTKYRYLDRDFQRKVRALMALADGLGEEGCRTALLRCSIEEIVADPMILRQYTPKHANRGVLRNLYMRLGKEMPIELAQMNRTKRATNPIGIDDNEVTIVNRMSI